MSRNRRKTGWNLLALALLALSAKAGAQTQGKTGVLPPLAPGSARQYVAVLMWHDVVAGPKQVWFDTTVAEFTAQLEAIRRRKFNVITMDALLQHLTKNTPLPPRPLVLTFDDNDQGLYDNAFPLLKQYRYPATFFVHTDYVGVTTDKRHCDWNSLRVMQASGLVSVQGHTRSHPADLRLLSDIGLKKELADAKTIMEKQMDRPVFAFAYPEGHYDARVARAVAQYGYRIAFIEDWGSASASKNLMMVHRYSIHKRFAQSLNDVERAWQR